MANHPSRSSFEPRDGSRWLMTLGVAVALALVAVVAGVLARMGDDRVAIAAVDASCAATTPTPAASPAADAVPIADARAMPNGARVTVAAVATTGSAFHDGGGYLADASGGIAVIVDGGSFSQGDRLEVTGVVGDRFAQRTIRADAGDVRRAQAAIAVEPIHVHLGAVGEANEGRLVRLAVRLDGPPTSLSGGVAFDVTDSTGSGRVVVGTATGIDVSTWTRGATVELIGVVGQRDSSGGGTSGYRIQPRSADDVQAVTPSSTPAPTATPRGGGNPTPAPSDGPAVATSIARARAAHVGTRLTTRGVVTMRPGTVDSETAVIQDASAAIVIRGDMPGSLQLGDEIEVVGARSTKSGMDTIRLTDPVRIVGTGSAPAPRLLRTGDAGEGDEAELIEVNGVLAQSARRAASGTVTLDVDDGSGPLRVVLPASLAADDAPLVAGVTVRATGVLGQETTGAKPSEGYRVWPRSAKEVRIVDDEGTPLAPAGGTTPGGGGTAPRGGPGGLDAVGSVGGDDLRVGATLVALDWPELGLAGVLWDGERVVGIGPGGRAAVDALAHVPTSLEIGGVRATGAEPATGVPIVEFDAGALSVASGSPSPPATSIPDEGAAWVVMTGTLAERSGELRLETAAGVVRLEVRCRQSDVGELGRAVAAHGIGVASGARLVVPCGGIRPAPSLARDGFAPSRGAVSPEADAVSAAREAEPTTGPRALAAGLLAAAAFVAMGGGAAGVRNRTTSPARARGSVDPSGPKLIRLRRGGPP